MLNNQAFLWNRQLAAEPATCQVAKSTRYLCEKFKIHTIQKGNVMIFLAVSGDSDHTQLACFPDQPAFLSAHTRTLHWCAHAARCRRNQGSHPAGWLLPRPPSITAQFRTEGQFVRLGTRLGRRRWRTDGDRELLTNCSTLHVTLDCDDYSTDDRSANDSLLLLYANNIVICGIFFIVIATYPAATRCVRHRPAKLWNARVNHA